MKIDTQGTSSFSIPTLCGGYSYEVDWGDGTVVLGYTGDASHTYTNNGVYDVKIRGNFPRISFSGSSEAIKVIEVIQFGDNLFSNFLGAFFNCTNLIRVSGTPKFSNNTVSFVNCFRSCSSLIQVECDNWNMVQVSSIAGMFRTANNPNLRLKIKNWNISNVTNGQLFLNGTNANVLGTSEYDQTLINWSSLSVQPNILMDFGTSKYTLGSAAATARQNLITNNGWTITDGGGI